MELQTSIFPDIEKRKGLLQDNFVANIVNCWLSEEIGERDLSGIDLRGIPLADHLKSKFTGKININNAWVDRQTFINDKHHDCIIDINFSHDGRTMAAILKMELCQLSIYQLRVK